MSPCTRGGMAHDQNSLRGFAPPSAPVLPEAAHKHVWFFSVETVAESHGLLLQEHTTARYEGRERLHSGVLRKPVRCFHELLRQYGEVMIIAQVIRQGMRLVNQYLDLGTLNWL